MHRKLRGYLSDARYSYCVVDRHINFGDSGIAFAMNSEVLTGGIRHEKKDNGSDVPIKS